MRVNRTSLLLWSAIAVLFVLGLASLFPKYGEICSQARDADPKNCATYDISRYALLKSLTLLQDYNGAITGVATAFIAAFTIILARVARNQSRITEVLQRAYLSVDIAGLNPYRRDDRSKHVVVCHINIRNAGNLPARDVSWSMKVTFSDTDDLVPEPISDADKFYGNNVVTPETVMRQGTEPFELHQSEGWIYVWGRVVYDDGFKRRRTTNFCHRYPRRMLEIMEQDGYGILPKYGRYHQHGNDAD